MDERYRQAIKTFSTFLQFDNKLRLRQYCIDVGSLRTTVSYSQRLVNSQVHPLLVFEEISNVREFRTLCAGILKA